MKPTREEKNLVVTPFSPEPVIEGEDVWSFDQPDGPSQGTIKDLTSAKFPDFNLIKKYRVRLSTIQSRYSRNYGMSLTETKPPYYLAKNENSSTFKAYRSYSDAWIGIKQLIKEDLVRKEMACAKISGTIREIKRKFIRIKASKNQLLEQAKNIKASYENKEANQRVLDLIKEKN